MKPGPTESEPFDEETLVEFWEGSSEPHPPHNPRDLLEGWSELVQLSATDLMRRNDEIVPRLAETNGFSLREAERALRGAVGGLTRHALLALWEEQGLHLLASEGGADGDHSPWPERTLIIGGGAIPQPTLQALVGGLMVSRRVLLRPSREDPWFVHEFVSTMEKVQSGAPRSSLTSAGRLGPIAERVRCLRWNHDAVDLTRRLVHRADALVIFGQESTVNLFSALKRPEADFFPYGPRLSFAVLDLTRPVRDEVMLRALDDFAQDVIAFDQRGCLSPQALYIVGADGPRLTSLSSELGRILQIREEDPQGRRPIPESVAAEIQMERATYAMDVEGNRDLRATAGLPGWTLLVDRSEIGLRPLPGYQTIRLCPLEDWEALPTALEGWEGRLQAVGIGPDTAALPEGIAGVLESMGVTRGCPLGRMQSPPLEWTHDGNPFFPVRLDV